MDRCNVELDASFFQSFIQHLFLISIGHGLFCSLYSNEQNKFSTLIWTYIVVEKIGNMEIKTCANDT